MSLIDAMKEVRAQRKYPVIKGDLTDQMNSWITQLGQEYEPAILPADIERGPVGTCFDTSFINTIFNPKYQYVEGRATAPDTGEWVYHGWLTDGVHAFDPTWLATKNSTGEEVAPAMVKYIGIPIPNAFVMMFVSKTEYQGVLANAGRYAAGVERMLEYRKRILEEERGK